MSPSGPALWAGEIEHALRSRVDPERREFTRGDFAGELEVLGVSVPRIREVVRDWARRLRGEDPRRIVELAGELVVGGTHEGRQAGYELLSRRRDAMALLGTRTVRRLGKGNDNWASVDSFSVLVAGPTWREGRIPDTEVARWARAKDRWWRRTALVSTVALNKRSRGGDGDPERTLALCRILVGDTDDMVAKGLSWALREVVPHDPGAVRQFLEEHSPVLAARVRREVGSKLETGLKNAPRTGRR